MKTILQINEALEARKTRSAWDRAVTVYALDILAQLDTVDDSYEITGSPYDRKLMLNGASNWSQYSYGGCALCYNWHIAERVCSPSELKRVTRKDGSLRQMANSRENWLDVQSRALYQACELIFRIARA